MAAVVIRNLPEDAHRALKERAKRHGRSTEAEIRSILVEAAGIGRSRDGLGTELHKLWIETGGWNDFHIPPRTQAPRIIDFSGPEFETPDFQTPESNDP